MWVEIMLQAFYGERSSMQSQPHFRALTSAHWRQHGMLQPMAWIGIWEDAETTAEGSDYHNATWKAHCIEPF
jgi:hypothetical protein